MEALASAVKKNEKLVVDFPGGTVDEKLPVNAEDMGLILG